MNEFEDMLKALDESTMVTITDVDGALLYVNNLFCKVSKYSKEELMGAKPHELLKSGYHTEEFYKDIWDTISKGNAWRGDVKNKAKDGSFFWTLTTILPFFDDEGKPYKYIAIRKDVTDKINLESNLKNALSENILQKKQIESQYEKLAEVDKLKEEFGSMITHELKTPLVPIKGYCKMLTDPDIFGELNEDQKEAVEEIHVNASRLESLITDILDAQKLDLNKMVFNKKECNVFELMNRIEKDMTHFTKLKKINFVNSTQDKKIILISDENRIIQVVENLVKNAVDFVPAETGRIEIDAKLDNDSIIFHVKDNGVGIPDEKQKSLFLKFYQTDTSQTRTHGGTGLGLAICKGLVEGMGGEIGVQSKVGVGSDFYFSISGVKV